MGKPILYGANLSPPVRACLLTAAALNLDIDFHIVNLLGGEHRSSEYMEKNPQHTIPTLEDDGKFIWDSHAIIAYLVGKYGNDDALYPKDLYKRAIVDQRLHFDSGVLFPKLRECVFRICLKKEISDVPQQIIEHFNDAYGFLEKFLGNNNFMVGDSMTIADLSLISTLSTIQGIIPLSEENHPKVIAWLKRMESLPYYNEANGKGSQDLINFVKSEIEKSKI